MFFVMKNLNLRVSVRVVAKNLVVKKAIMERLLKWLKTLIRSYPILQTTAKIVVSILKILKLMTMNADKKLKFLLFKSYLLNIVVKSRSVLIAGKLTKALFQNL